MPNKMRTFRPVKATLKKMVVPEARPNAGDRGYDARWQRYRLDVIREHVQTHGPFCAECQAPLDFHRGTHVDHIEGHDGQDDPKFWDRSNLRVICRSCHSSKTRRDTGRGRGDLNTWRSTL